LIVLGFLGVVAIAGFVAWSTYYIAKNNIPLALGIMMFWIALIHLGR